METQRLLISGRSRQEFYQNSKVLSYAPCIYFKNGQVQAAPEGRCKFYGGGRCIAYQTQEGTHCQATEQTKQTVLEMCRPVIINVWCMALGKPLIYL